MLRQRAFNRPQGNRHGNRLRLSVAAGLVLTHKTRRCLIDNISPLGARLRVDEQIAKGRSVVLQFHELRLFGTVMWCSGGECGLRFEQELSQEDMEGFLWITQNPAAYRKVCKQSGVHAWASGIGA
jgi:hypothetical protein